MAETLIDTRLGDLLVRKGYITPEQLYKAADEQRQHGGPLSRHLVKLGCLTEDALLAYLQKEYRLPLADPASLEISDEVIQLVPHVLVTKYHLVPIGLNGSSLTLAMSDPSNLVAVDEVKFLTGYDVKVAVATVSSIQQVIDWVKAVRAEELRKHAGDPGPVLARRLSNSEYNYTVRDLTGELHGRRRHCRQIDRHRDRSGLLGKVCRRALAAQPTCDLGRVMPQR